MSTIWKAEKYYWWRLLWSMAIEIFLDGMIYSYILSFIWIGLGVQMLGGQIYKQTHRQQGDTIRLQYFSFWK
jgi:hypothetical protein